MTSLYPYLYYEKIETKSEFVKNGRLENTANCDWT